MSNDITKYVIGCDISKYDVEFNDYTKKITSIWNPDNVIKPAHIDFVIQRVSYGAHQDQFVNELYEQVKKVSIRGAYHYFTSGLGWKVQLDTILAAVKNKNFHFFAIDYEKIYNNLNATSFAEMMELAKQLKLATGKKIILYFNVDVYQNYMKPYNADAVINDFFVWFAMYPWKIFVDFDKKPSLLPKNITNCKLWQFGGDASKFIFGYGEGKNYGSPAASMDLSVWYGSLDEMKIWAGVTDSPVVNPPPIPESKVRYTGNVLGTVSDGLKIRNAPVNGDKIGLLNHDDYFEADTLTSGWFHITFPISGYISAMWTKYLDNDKITIPDPNPQSKLAIPGPFKLQSDLDLGISWESRFPNSKLDSYPATINLVGGTGQVQLSKSYLEQLQKINTPAQYARIFTDEHGWHNKPHGEIGRVQQVTFAHSDVWVTGEDDKYYYVDVYYNDEKCPDLNLNYDKYRINIFSIMSKNDAKNNGGIYYDNTGYIKIFLIANNRTEKLKIEKIFCKSSLNLPIDCKIKTDGSNVNIRKTPANGEILGSYKNNQVVTILEIVKVDNKIWLKTNLGFVASWLTDLDI